MRIKPALIALCLFSLLTAPAQPCAEGPGGSSTLVIDNFSGAGPGSWPDGWEALSFPSARKHTTYTVQKDGDNLFLKAESSVSASAVYKRLTAEAREYPVLSWSWKVDGTAASPDERLKSGDDYAARVYVTFEYEPEKATAFEKFKRAIAKGLFGVDPPGNAISYVWANSLKRGEAITNPFTEKVMMVAVESGSGLVGRWIREERNILDDYRRLFKAEPPRISGIVVMTDTDNTTGSTAAYYDDFVLRSH